MHDVRPVKLLRVCRQLKLDGETPVRLEASDEDLAAARALLDSYLATKSGRRQSRRSPTRGEARGLVELLAALDERKHRRAAVRLLLKAGSLSWRRFWAVWEDTALEFPEIGAELGQRILKFTKNGTRRLDRLPEWLPKRRDLLLSALHDPSDYAKRYVEKASVPIRELYSALQISLASRTGVEVVFHILDQASSKWWSQVDDHEVRDWASGTKLEFRAVVANRQLLEFAGNASGPNNLPVGKESEALKRWILKELDDPAIRPANWERVSDDAAQVFEWLLVRGELAKILREFEKHAEDDRAAFWSCYFDGVRDALFVQARESSVCLMVVGDLLVVEFGRTGNACYFYEAPKSPLRLLEFDTKPSVSDFKGRWGLVLGGDDLTFHLKRSHNASWQYDFVYQLAQVFSVDSSAARKEWGYR